MQLILYMLTGIAILTGAMFAFFAMVCYQAGHDVWN